MEFALILSLLFIVLFGIIQFGIAFNRYQSINAAAREGARLGSIGGTTVSSIQSRALQSLSILNANNFKSGGNVVHCASWGGAVESGCIDVFQAGNATSLADASIPCDGDATHTSLTVTVKYKMRITIPLWASPAVTATGSGVFRCENT